jgi:serine/threonine-protein kinase RsbW
MRVKSIPDVKFCLVFRSETLSVPVMRRVLGDTLRGLGVDEESVYDILLAATEACTNVLVHGGRQAAGYAVVASLGAVGCQVEVADERSGAQLPEAGFREARPRSTGLRRAGSRQLRPHRPGPAPVPAAPGPETAIARLPESGRGLAVMRACVDNVSMDSSPEHGTVVTMRKHIRWSRDAPLRQFRAAS